MKKNEHIDISIVVPIYNTGKYLKKCIDSLLNQTKKEIEIILINDGSTDNSEDIVKEYNDERIVYFKNKNQGIGKTRNFGIRKSRGDFLMFIDSDDYIREDCCEIMYKDAIKNKSDIVVSDFYKDYYGRYETIKIDSFSPSSLEDNKNLFLIINPGPCNKIYKRELIINNKIIFDEEHKYEDSPFVMNAIAKAKIISKVDEPLSYYCIHRGSETTVRDERVFDLLYIIDKIRKDLKGLDYLKENLDIFTVDLITNYTIQQRAQKDKKIAMKFIDEAFKYLKKEVPDYKDKKYYKNKKSIRRLVESNKRITKIYCRFARYKYEKG